MMQQRANDDLNVCNRGYSESSFPCRCHVISCQILHLIQKWRRSSFCKTL